MHIASIVIMKNRYKFVSPFNIQYFSLNFKIGQSGNLSAKNWNYEIRKNKGYIDLEIRQFYSILHRKFYSKLQL